MGDILIASVQFPTVVFTVVLLVALVLWVLPLVGVDGGSEGGVEGAEGSGGVLDTLGLTGVPLSIVLTIVGLCGWGVSVLGQLLVLDPLSGFAGVAVGIVVLIVAAGAALGLTATVGPKLARRLEPTLAPNAADLVGRTVEVRSHAVSTTHGYGDARSADGTSLRIDIRTRDDRADGTAPFGAGDIVLIIDYDSDLNSYIVDQLPSWL